MLWGIESNLTMTQLSSAHILSQDTDDGVRSVTFSPTNANLAASGDDAGDIVLWDTSSSKLTEYRRKSFATTWRDDPVDVVFAPGGTRLLFTEQDQGHMAGLWLFDFGRSAPRVSLVDTTISNSTAPVGAGIYLEGCSGHMERVNFSACNATQYGGALGVQSASVDANNVGFTGCHSSRTGSALWARNSPLTLKGATFARNTADDGAIVQYDAYDPTWLASHPAAWEPPISTAVDALFIENTAAFTVRAFAAISWTCPLGKFMPRTGLAIGDFAGCPHMCAGGFVGSTSNATDATCSGACPVGHVCPTGTAEPSPCPAGTYMPVTGASGDCIPCAAGSYQEAVGQDTCIACEPGYVSEVGARFCTASPERACDNEGYGFDDRDLSQSQADDEKCGARCAIGIGSGVLLMAIIFVLTRRGARCGPRSKEGHAPTMKFDDQVDATSSKAPVVNIIVGS